MGIQSKVSKKASNSVLPMLYSSAAQAYIQFIINNFKGTSLNYAEFSL